MALFRLRGEIAQYVCPSMPWNDKNRKTTADSTVRIDIKKSQGFFGEYGKRASLPRALSLRCR